MHILSLSRNGSIKGATQMLIRVDGTDGGTAEYLDAAFDMVRNETTLKDANKDNE